MNFDRPFVFNSLADARETLEIYTYYYRQQHSELNAQNPQLEIRDSDATENQFNFIAPEAVSLCDATLSLLEQWSKALDEFLDRHGASLSIRERRGASLLQLRKIDSFVALDAHPAAGEMKADHNYVWDKYNSYFEQMVALGESINGLHSSHSRSPSPSVSLSSCSSKTFSLDLGITACMFNVAAHCRDPNIRRRAVRVLRSSKIQEGVWDSVAIAAIAEKWIEIEEEGLDIVTSCADIPASSRLTQFLPVFDNDQPSAVVYFSYSLKLDPANVRKEVLRW